MNQRDAATADHVPRALNSFVGRERLLTDLRRRLGAAPLITLTGVGGGGKTRLALELARQVSRAFEDGVRVAQLASARGGDPELLAQVVLSAVGVPDQSTTAPLDALVAYLRPRRVLLVLDNCEHLVEPVATLVQEVLGAAPGVRVVATSRERLRVPGEVLVAVPPLEVPAEDARPEQRCEAVQLLVDRAQAGIPGWRVTEEIWPDVVRVVRRVSGIPLGVEMVAVRMRVMPVGLLADRLDDLMRELTANDNVALEHHRTMAALIEWDHDLCSPAERLLWARLSVFEGGFGLPAAEAVCAAGGLPVADVLLGLIDKSIVLATEDRSRYHLLEPLRQHGAARLRLSTEEDAVRELHREYYRSEAARLAATFRGRNEAAILAAVEADVADYRVVLADLISSAPHTGLQTAVDLARTRWYTYAGRLPEEMLWLRRALAAAPASADPLRASAIALDAWIAMCLGVEHDEVARRVEEASAIAEAFGGPVPAVTFVRGAFRVLALSDLEGVPELRAGRDGFDALGPDFAVDRHLADILLTVGAVLLDDEVPARAAAAAFFAHCERLGAQWGLSWAHWCSGVVEVRFGDAERAVEVLTAGLRIQQAIRDRWTPVWTVEALGWAWARASHPRQAARMLGLAETLQGVLGIHISRLTAFADARTIAVGEARAALSADEYAKAYANATDSVEHAIELVLDDTDVPDEAPRRPADLTPTEWEVAKLVAEGLTNQQVADRLVVSPKTVYTHLTRVYRKLQIDGRHQLATRLASLT
ncbi:LuxR C-terminal-related transcriptional regulator [Actinosynnema sp. NPDC020468]|uniref:ATP-binding protein n=1 Tax=Actinosynnema sp. NPDC020468 TaxID=3154488 RepID=UPI0033CDD82F